MALSSLRFGHLESLARLLRCQQWPQPLKVDVVILDFASQPSEPRLTQVFEIDDLHDIIASDVPQDVALRLYLVEDVAAPVIEALGSALRCQPDVFADHMYSDLDLNRGILRSGYSEVRRGRDVSVPFSYIRSQKHFSVPFQRSGKYKSKLFPADWMTPGTGVHRNLDHQQKTREERISGVMLDVPDCCARIGMSYVVPFRPASSYS